MNIRQDGKNFVLTLSHDECQQVTNIGAIASGVWPPIAPAIDLVAAEITAMDLIGGNNGVEISGTVGSTQIIILPAGKGIWGGLVHTLQEIESIIASVTPGVVIVEFLKKIIPLPGSGPGQDVHFRGESIQGDERFFFILNHNEKYGILSLRSGKFLTVSLNDQNVYAARDKWDVDEEFTLTQQGVGQVSLLAPRLHERNNNGYVSSNADDDNRMTAVRNAIGRNEIFKMHFEGNGVIGLEDYRGKFASVAT